jgi:2'-5' RNA ligase
MSGHTPWREIKRKAVLSDERAEDMKDDLQVAPNFPGIAQKPRLPHRTGVADKSAASAGIFAIKNANHSGVMVALRVPLAAAKRIALPKGEAPEDLHVTLAYLGDANVIDPDKRADLVERLKRIAETTEPICGTICGYGRFRNPGPTGDDPKDPSVAEDILWVGFDAPDLPELRHRVVQACHDAALPPAGEHGFTPHITLAYVAEGEGEDTMPKPTEVEIKNLSFVFGTTEMQIALKGSPKEHDKTPEPPLAPRTFSMLQEPAQANVHSVTELERWAQGRGDLIVRTDVDARPCIIIKKGEQVHIGLEDWNSPMYVDDLIVAMKRIHHDYIIYGWLAAKDLHGQWIGDDDLNHVLTASGTPATPIFMPCDLLALDGDLTGKPAIERRELMLSLVPMAGGHVIVPPQIVCKVEDDLEECVNKAIEWKPSEGEGLTILGVTVVAADSLYEHGQSEHEIRLELGVEKEAFGVGPGPGEPPDWRKHIPKEHLTEPGFLEPEKSVVQTNPDMGDDTDAGNPRRKSVWGIFAEIEKFEESEPRDEQGKWTAEGIEVKQHDADRQAYQIRAGSTNAEVHIQGDRLEVDYIQDEADRHGYGPPTTPERTRDVMRVLHGLGRFAKLHHLTEIHAQVVNAKLGRLLRKLSGVEWQPAPGKFEQSGAGTYTIPVTVLKAIVQKYAEDEPRDDHGRWTEGGSGAVGSADAPKWKRSKHPTNDYGHTVSYAGKEHEVYFNPDTASWRSHALLSAGGGVPVDHIGFSKAEVNAEIVNGRLDERLEQHLVKEAPKSITRNWEKIHKAVLLPDGGVTLQPLTGHQPTSGFAVSIYPERGMVIPHATELTKETLAQFVDLNGDLLSQGNHYLGLWNDPADGRVHLDISVVKHTEKEAAALGKKHNQISYFNFATGSSVNVQKDGFGGFGTAGTSGILAPAQGMFRKPRRSRNMNKDEGTNISIGVPLTLIPRIPTGSRKKNPDKADAGGPVFPHYVGGSDTGVHKYSEDQPRDDHGRWSETGAGATTAQASGKKDAEWIHNRWGNHRGDQKIAWQKDYTDHLETFRVQAANLDPEMGAKIDNMRVGFENWLRGDQEHPGKYPEWVRLTHEGLFAAPGNYDGNGNNVVVKPSADEWARQQGQRLQDAAEANPAYGPQRGPIPDPQNRAAWNLEYARLRGGLGAPFEMADASMIEHRREFARWIGGDDEADPRAYRNWIRDLGGQYEKALPERYNAEGELIDKPKPFSGLPGLSPRSNEGRAPAAHMPPAQEEYEYRMIGDKLQYKYQDKDGVDRWEDNPEQPGAQRIGPLPEDLLRERDAVGDRGTIQEMGTDAKWHTLESRVDPDNTQGIQIRDRLSGEWKSFGYAGEEKFQDGHNYELWFNPGENRAEWKYGDYQPGDHKAMEGGNGGEHDFKMDSQGEWQQQSYTPSESEHTPSDEEEERSNDYEIPAASESNPIEGLPASGVSSDNTEGQKHLLMQGITNFDEKDGNHVNPAYRVTFVDGTAAMWKPAPYTDIYQLPDPDDVHEQAASDLAHLAGMDDIVPAAVKRQIDGVDGSLQEWKKGNKPNSGRGEPERKDNERALSFDYIIGNFDRHGGNYLHGEEVSTVPDPENANQTLEQTRTVPYLIDNGTAFPEEGRTLGLRSHWGVDAETDNVPDHIIAAWKPLLANWENTDRMLKRSQMSSEAREGVHERLKSLVHIKDAEPTSDTPSDEANTMHTWAKLYTFGGGGY